jgi:hypothetical protein
MGKRTLLNVLRFPHALLQLLLVRSDVCEETGMQFLMDWVDGVGVLFGEVEELLGERRRRVEGVPRGGKISSE